MNHGGFSPNAQGWQYQDAAALQDAAAASAASGGMDLTHGSESSSETFKNIHIVLEHVQRVQTLTRNVMFWMENAYDPNTNPNQTAQEIVALKQAIQALYDVMRETGIGALPLVPPSPFDEEELLKECSKGVQALYEKSRNSQDSAKIVSDLLGPPLGQAVGRQ